MKEVKTFLLSGREVADAIIAALVAKGTLVCSVYDLDIDAQKRTGEFVFEVRLSREVETKNKD